MKQFFTVNYIVNEEHIPEWVLYFIEDINNNFDKVSNIVNNDKCGDFNMPADNLRYTEDEINMIYSVGIYGIEHMIKYIGNITCTHLSEIENNDSFTFQNYQKEIGDVAYYEVIHPVSWSLNFVEKTDECYDTLKDIKELNETHFNGLWEWLSLIKKMNQIHAYESVYKIVRIIDEKHKDEIGEMAKF
jgi:hypothetical protein